MDNRTHINPTLNNASQTLSSHATVINTAVQACGSITQGTMLLDKYEVICPMDVKTGEADLYICRYRGNGYVAKVYRRAFAIKEDVINKLHKIDSPYVAKLYESGIVNGFPAEIIPYYKLGSLQGKRFSLEQIRRDILPALNEGLHVLHENGVIHKDLKPSNIMLCDNGKDVAIIDFGISSVVQDGSTFVVTRTGMTPEYSAHETFRNLFLEESDYYSLGITLFELFCGYTPYGNIEPEKVEQFMSIQKIPFPDDMPQQLCNLISSLTYADITHRKDKSNPNRRWTYEEVKLWYKGETLPIPGECAGRQAASIPPYTFAGGEYNGIVELTNALGRSWKEGKRHLFKGLLSKFYANYDPEIAMMAQDAEDEAAKAGGKDDVIFWRLLYRFVPEMRTFYWEDHAFESMPALGRDMLEHLWQKDSSDYTFYNRILKERLMSQYVQLHDAENEALLVGATALEDAYQQAEDETNKLTLVYFETAYLLSGQRTFKSYNEKEFNTIGQLTEYMKALLEASYEQFEHFCHSMIDYDDNLNPQLEAWLIALGKREELEQWRKSLAE